MYYCPYSTCSSRLLDECDIDTDVLPEYDGKIVTRGNDLAFTSDMMEEDDVYYKKIKSYYETN
jgi:hypothetical protein